MNAALFPRLPVRRAVFFSVLVAILIAFSGCGLSEQSNTGSSHVETEAKKTAAPDIRSTQPNAVTANRPPNVVWILLDACRARNLSCYGYERKTSPNIDLLAKNGVVVEACFSQGLRTIYSLPSMLTGRYFPVFRHATGSWRELWRTPPPHERLIHEILKDAGYTTATFTAHPEFGPESRLGQSFEECFFVKPSKLRNKTYALFEEINETLFPWLETRGDRPFFAYVHTLDTHFPHSPLPPHDQWIDQRFPGAAKLEKLSMQGSFFRFDSGAQKFLRGLYDGDIHYTDSQIGRLRDKLAALGILENTIIVITADHGDALGEDGRTLGHPDLSPSDEVMHVPLVMSGPGIPPGRRIKALAENVDIVPTLLDLLGIESDADFDGESLVPLMDDEAALPIHDYIFLKYQDLKQSRIVDAKPVFVLRNSRYKFENKTATQEARLWQVPDLLRSRRNVASANPAVSEEMGSWIERDLLHKWAAYDALPWSSPVPFLEKLPATADPPGSFVPIFDTSWTDNLWALGREGIASCGWQEDSPPITLHIEIPNGRYVVYMNMRSERNYKGHPASAFMIKAENDVEFTKIVHDTGKSGYEYVSIGTYDVKDESFDITLDEGSTEHWAMAKGFRFVPAGTAGEASSLDDAKALEEQVEALGYL